MTPSIEPGMTMYKIFIEISHAVDFGKELDVNELEKIRHE